jgi:hypothetical protein
MVPSKISSNNNEKTLLDNGKLLALVYPQGLFGGYRNQVIRFLALVVHALKENIPRILLPSVLWSTQVGNSTTYAWVPIPMDLLMDIDYWNSFYPKLPLLVAYNAQETYDCWTVEPTTPTTNWPSNATSLSIQVVQRGFLTPIYNISKQIALQQIVINQRRTDLLPNVTHCQKPLTYGGGKMGGRLWNDYVHMHEKKGEIPFNAQPLVLQALRPKREWREVATQCVERHTPAPNSPYIALHARVELEMMHHPCGRDMEKNLTRIMDMVGELAATLAVKGVFVAVGRSGMEHQETRPGYNNHAAYLEENLVTLNRVVAKDGGGLDIAPGLFATLLFSKSVPVFECGREALEEYYRSTPGTMDYGGLVQGMINFHVATEATAFVGVRGSSYSTDIWTTRYHQGKGDTNYEYTSNGIVRMDNGGLPPAHSNCKQKRGDNNKNATANEKKK